MTRWYEMSQWELTAAQKSHPFCDCPIRLSSVGCRRECLQLAGSCKELLMSSVPQEDKWLGCHPLQWCQDHAKLCI